MKTISPEQTMEIGKQLATRLKGGDIVLLHGELGAGKTTLVKGIASTLGIIDDIVSPTFTLMNVYGLQSTNHSLRTFVHVDTYRLENEQQLIDIGIEDYLGYPETLCVIEWPEKIAGLLKDKRVINIELVHNGDNKREINVRELES